MKSAFLIFLCTCQSHIIWGSRTRNEKLLNWLLKQPEVTLNSLNLSPDAIALDSPEIDIEKEFSAFNRPAQIGLLV
ncbi:hypothetical protein BdWA1_001724 [Babesia duncani]|uniref:Uncharacterized protein n=1 Tax=Babesia duncani TaxID=323732 RepID=A0AAD9PKE4_9APIC|nr:hypothetical protein BdWA1_001724 [Babesia duncani]